MVAEITSMVPTTGPASASIARGLTCSRPPRRRLSVLRRGKNIRGAERQGLMHSLAVTKCTWCRRAVRRGLAHRGRHSTIRQAGVFQRVTALTRDDLDANKVSLSVVSAAKFRPSKANLLPSGPAQLTDRCGHTEHPRHPSIPRICPKSGVGEKTTNYPGLLRL